MYTDFLFIGGIIFLLSLPSLVNKIVRRYESDKGISANYWKAVIFVLSHLAVLGVDFLIWKNLDAFTSIPSGGPYGLTCTLIFLILHLIIPSCVAKLIYKTDWKFSFILNFIVTLSILLLLFILSFVMVSALMTMFGQ